MRWVLLGMICTAYDPQCDWQRFGMFRTETICMANGLALDPSLQFKCVRELPVPLPRPRPAALQ